MRVGRMRDIPAGKLIAILMMLMMVNETEISCACVCVSALVCGED